MREKACISPEVYTVLVYFILGFLLCGYLGLSVLLVAIYGYIAATASDGPRKGRARLVAALSAASWLVVFPLCMSLYESHLPVFEFEGTITSVRVSNSDSKHYSAMLEVGTTLGGRVEVHASGRSDGWKPGQRIRVRYYGDTGELIEATFYNSDGRKQGVFHRAEGAERFISILLGLFLSWYVWRRFRSDPEGATEPTSGFSDAVDRKSLLQLSDQGGETER